MHILVSFLVAASCFLSFISLFFWENKCGKKLSTIENSVMVHEEEIKVEMGM
jgi:hypothetical protein